ncbi:DNA-binding domain of Mlu1-box binding protein MBP1, partial [Bimuria novae-zelandiae CBS 107.79]
LPKRQKIPKDAPIFSEGTKVVGYVNYPPHEGSEDENLAAQHRRFKLFPMGEIHKKGVRHVPYNSDKKDFLNKTGRESFELFQYTYRVGTDDKEYVVLWDYNVGLVRMTPFFKSLKYSKTIPAKALRENPGLKDISYSITGGALVCQGYWMPYQAAKAIAATFCWHIRWVLTPVFGYDFPDMCVHPNDPRYSKFVIDPKIVQECINETNRFREEGAAYKVAGHLESAKADTPQLPILNSPWNPMPDHPRKSVESGYYTGGDQNERPSASPQESPMGSTWVTPWTSVNGPKS